MKYITAIIDFIKNILGYISSEPAEVDNFLVFLGVIFSCLMFIRSIICVIAKQVVTHSKSEKNCAKRWLKEYNYYVSAMLKSESVFFSEDDPKKLLFYKRVPIQNYHSGKKSFLTKLKFSSYILLGEAGSGKSSIIKNDYLFHCNKFMRFWRIRTGFVYINQQFLSYNNKGMSSPEKYLEELMDCIQCTKYKKIYLYLDGIDEFGENRFDQIFKSFLPISKQIKKVKITSRTHFAIQNVINHDSGRLFGFKEKQRHIVKGWQKEHLIRLAFFLLKHLKIEKLKRKGITDKIEYESENWHKYIDSPLLIKLYLYILTYGNQNKKIDIENKYRFYTQFLTEIIATQRNRQGNFSNAKIHTELDKLSGFVFAAFSNDHKYIQHSKNIAALLKPENNGISHFVHETFFEYFVARNYLLQLSKKSPDNEAILALKQTYTNDFADFITSALNSKNEKERKQIVNMFLFVYYFTLEKNMQKEYLEKFTSVSYYINFFAQFQPAIQQLTEREFFTLKYEIIFRLGRIDADSNEIVKFLNFVYYNDQNIRLKENPEYYIAVLKRCCAISCSFLGSEQIELDYARKMIPCNKSGVNADYIPNYDLANRSHTLLFYGDVIKTNIFDFKDDAANNPFALAFAKRIERLKLALPEDISQMKKKQKKKYYFRVFDLTTIYTFMFNRRKALSNEELKIVSNTKVHFVGASGERNDFMQEVLDLILQLNEELKVS